MGYHPVGFRAPGYDIDEETIDILTENDYLYDSSLFPSYLVPIIKYYTSLSMSKGKRGHSADGYGNWPYGFGPIAPYRRRCGAIGRHGSMKIWEAPVSMIPGFRFPLHASALFFYPKPFIRSAWRCIAYVISHLHFCYTVWIC